MSETPARARNAAEIEAELEATRLALTTAVNELHYRIKPSTQINNAKESAKSFIGKTGDSASEFLHDATTTTARLATGTVSAVRKIGQDAKNGEPVAIGIVVGTVVGIAALIALPLLRSKR